MKDKLKLTHSQAIYDRNEVRQRLKKLLQDNKPRFKSKDHKRGLVAQDWLNAGIGSK